MHSLSLGDSGDADKVALYARLRQEVESITAGEQDWIANAANCAAVLFHALPEINWAGFYFLKGQDLVLGPFQGRPACVRIGPGRGVCGAAVVRRQTLVAPNVHEFPGHIACDPASNSEIVIPLVSRDRILGVLDIDSPRVNRFDADDAAGLEAIVATLIANSDIVDDGKARYPG